MSYWFSSSSIGAMLILEQQLSFLTHWDGQSNSVCCLSAKNTFILVCKLLYFTLHVLICGGGNGALCDITESHHLNIHMVSAQMYMNQFECFCDDCIVFNLVFQTFSAATVYFPV